MAGQQLDDRLTAVAKDAVERFRSLRNQNDGVLVSIIRDCLLCEYQFAAAEEREACAKLLDDMCPDDDISPGAVLAEGAREIRARNLPDSRDKPLGD